MTRGLMFLLPVLLVACGSTPAPRLPENMARAQTADADARRALRDGELLRAQKYFAKALASQQSVDDTAGAATSMINLATVSHQLHDDEAAIAWLDKLLLEKTHIYPADSILTASFRKAVILTGQSRITDADVTLQSTENQCAGKCSLRFGIDALRARLLLLNGEAQGAKTLALNVVGQADAGKEEQANALRVAAAAEESLKLDADALQHYQTALEMDKALGISIRIAEDLDGLARVSARLGREQEAAEYSRRAALVKDAQR